MARKKIKLNTNQRPFIMVYHDFLESELLDNPYQITLYICLKKFANENNQCFPSLKRLSMLTKMSISKVKITLNELEEKGVIVKENRTKPNGGATSNLYTLYDYKELWKAENVEQIKKTVDIEELQLFELAKKKGYILTKEKEPETLQADQSNNISSTQLNNIDTNKDNTNKPKSQDLERYTLDQIKQFFEYDILVADHPKRKTDIDIVFTILDDALNWTNPTIRVNGQDKPILTVIGRLMKLEQSDLWYAIEKYHEQQGRIKNVNAYLLTILYHAKEQSYLDLMNLGHHNGDF